MKAIDKRLSALETAQQPGDDGRTFVVDIGSDLPRYWIDGVEVDAATWRGCVPPNGPYVVDVGDHA